MQYHPPFTDTILKSRATRVAQVIQRESSVLVTGGNGFIGRHLVQRLLELDCRITIVNRNPLESKAPAGLKVYSNGLSNALKSSLIKPGDFEYVFHLAGNSSVGRSVSDPVGDFRSCIEETIFLLEALRMAAKPPLLVFPSSAAVYGEPKSLPIKESDPTIPLSPYGVSKLATENYIAVYCRLYGLRSVCFRPFSLYGPYQKQLVIFDFINKLNANPKRLEVLGDGNQQRDFLYIDDFISLMLYACDPLSPPGYSETYNAASGISYSIRELLAVVCDVMELSPQIIYSNINRPGDPLKWAVDVTKIRRLGFSSATPLSAGLRQVLNWFYTENISELSTKERY